MSHGDFLDHVLPIVGMVFRCSFCHCDDGGFVNTIRRIAIIPRFRFTFWTRYRKSQNRLTCVRGAWYEVFVTYIGWFAAARAFMILLYSSSSAGTTSTAVVSVKKRTKSECHFAMYENGRQQKRNEDNITHI